MSRPRPRRQFSLYHRSIAFQFAALASGAPGARADAPCDGWAEGAFPYPGAYGDPRAFAMFDEGSGRRLFVGGEFRWIGGTAAWDIARWDGWKWTDLGVPIATGGDVRVFSLAAFDQGPLRGLYAGG